MNSSRHSHNIVLKLAALPMMILGLAQCVEFEPPYGPPPYGPGPGPGSGGYSSSRHDGPTYPAAWESRDAPHPSSPWAEPASRRPASQRQQAQAQAPSRRSSPSWSTDSSRKNSGPPWDGIVTDSSTGNRTHRDRSTGEIVGSEWTSPAGNTTYRKADGTIAGSSWESPAGTTTYRKADGTISLTSSTTAGTGGDSTTYYRRNGTIVGTKYISPAGNTTWRDGSGSIISGPSEMK